ncbi:VOC family protein [Brevifollis gellanilyticus]|nr:VOC family protein [Brevifollis gellanilyticus]
MIYITLPTKDLQRARTFYTALGFAENEKFSGEHGVGIIISETIQVMLCVESFFATISPRELCDTSKFVSALHCLSCASKDEVDELVRKAVGAGGSTFEEAEDHGFMYQHSFLDPDGNGWALMHVPEAEAG